MTQESQEEEFKPVYKQPEFILIDERDGQKKYSYFGSDPSQPSQGPFESEQTAKKSAKANHSLRFVCFLGLIFCLIFGCGMLIWSTVMTGLAIVTLFQNPALNKSMLSFWKIFFNTTIAAVGFTIGLISPTMGLSLLALYFTFSGNLADDDLLRKVIRRSFSGI